MKTFALCGPNPAPLTKAEAITLAYIAKQLPANPVIVQIGAYIGASTVAFLETRPDAFIFSIDIKPWQAERENVTRFGLDTSRVVRVLGDSSQIDWPRPVNLLYIDGNHFYEAVKADCDRWLDKVDGLVVFHDYILEKAPPKNQVAQVVNEVFGNKPVILLVGRLICFEMKAGRNGKAGDNQ